MLLLALVFGDADLGDADADGPFSLPAIAAFLGGIGFGGAAVTAVLPDLPGVATVLVALVGGLVVALPLAAGAVRLSAALRDMPTEPTLPSGHLIGAQGVVVSRVPAGRLGEVRLTVAGPNQAFLVTGRQGRSATSCDGAVSRDMPGQKVVMGASVFVLRVVQKLHSVDLSSRRIPVGIRGAVSKQGVKCSRASRS